MLNKKWSFLDLNSVRELEPVDAEQPAVAPAESPPQPTPPAALSDDAVTTALEAERAKAREREAFIHQLQGNLAESKQEVARLTHEFETLQLRHYRLNNSHDDLIASLRKAHATVEQYTSQRKGPLGRLLRRH
jgi:septal ring factor EnvC (AmiA/AmiB activator)